MKSRHNTETVRPDKHTEEEEKGRNRGSEIVGERGGKRGRNKGEERGGRRERERGEGGMEGEGER